MFRGGAYKPRSSPYSFRGLGRQGLILLAEAKAQTGLPIVTEVLDARDIELVAEVADVVQIGARNMQNYTLLTEVGLSGIPVLLKRGLAATLDELLMSAEYILKEGNNNVMLCERGIRTFEGAYRFHPRPNRRSRSQGAHPPSGYRRSEPRRGATESRHAALAGGRGGRCGRHHRRNPSRSR